MKLPDEFKQRMNALLGGEYPAFLASYDRPAQTGLRANALKISARELCGILNIPYEPVPWCEDGFYFDDSFRAGKSPCYHAGLYYIQEPSAMSPASVMDVMPGMRVLDLCAAPGGKSTHIAAKLNGIGVLISNDVSASRLKALLKNIECAGVTNCVVSNEPPERLTVRFANYFDRILVDAPCSGEGMFRKDADAVKSWEIHKTNACQNMQRDILYHAAKMLAGGGRLMYSTCTFTPEENELIIAEFLRNNADFEMVGIEPERYGFSPGIGLVQAGRLWPHRIKGEGHFLAYLQKRQGSRAEIPPARAERLKGFELFTEFCETHLNRTFAGKFELHGQSLFLVPEDLPPLGGIRLKRSGFYLGDLLNKRFEPSQALAMGLRAADARYVINFPADSEYLFRYLKGESFDYECPDGWNLVCVDGYPLGWGKAKDGRVKNKYLKAWIMN